jgi:hypothetical protein
VEVAPQEAAEELVVTARPEREAIAPQDLVVAHAPQGAVRAHAPQEREAHALLTAAIAVREPEQERVPLAQELPGQVPARERLEPELAEIAQLAAAETVQEVVTAVAEAIEVVAAIAEEPVAPLAIKQDLLALAANRLKRKWRTQKRPSKWKAPSPQFWRGRISGCSSLRLPSMRFWPTFPAKCGNGSSGWWLETG